MRIASVLHDASPEPDGAPLLPAVALERDGALYRVCELARAFGPRFAELSHEPTFHQAVIALGGALVRELDERLKAGERPSSARILPGTFTWLPPCDTDRAALVICGPYDAHDARAHDAAARGAGGGAERDARDDVPHAEPSFRVGSARALYGHDATVPLLARAGGDAPLDVECVLAVVLGDDVWRAAAAEAERAILGYTLLLGWGVGLTAQLGPVLVTRDEAGPIAGLRAQLRVEGGALAIGDAGAQAFSPAESIAWVSHHMPLHAGDVIGVGRLRGGTVSGAGAPIAYGATVELAVERIGRLCGRPVRGPEMRAWRKTSGR